MLFWGILGALVMRGAMIAAGAYLIQQFHWIIYVFGAFLVFTGVRMATQTEHDLDPGIESASSAWCGASVPVTDVYHGQQFFVREQAAAGSRLVATPLFVVLAAGRDHRPDLRRRLDPRDLRGHADPFIVYTSNVFAILGLRALYFLLADVIHRFHYLKVGLSVVLVFVGVKMLAADLYKIPIGVSLGIIVLVLGLATAASWWWPLTPQPEKPDPQAAPEIRQPTFVHKP